MYLKSKSHAKTLVLFCLATICLHTSALAAPLVQTSFVTDIISTLTSTVNILSSLYFYYLHDNILKTISTIWPSGWPQYDAMLSAYKSFFHTIPLWFTGHFWPATFLGKFPHWGIDLFIATEILYLALRLVTHKTAPFKGGMVIRFTKTMIYESWVFVKAPFFALFSVLFFIIKDEQGKRRVLLFWLYATLITAIVIALIAWRASYL